MQLLLLLLLSLLLILLLLLFCSDCLIFYINRFISALIQAKAHRP